MNTGGIPAKTYGPTEFITDVLFGVFWLFETAPLTTLSGLALVFAYFGGVDGVETSRLVWIPLLMLVDGFVGRRHAQRLEQNTLENFHRWHAEEMAKNREKD